MDAAKDADSPGANETDGGVTAIPTVTPKKIVELAATLESTMLLATTVMACGLGTVGGA